MAPATLQRWRAEQPPSKSAPEFVRVMAGGATGEVGGAAGVVVRVGAAEVTVSLGFDAEPLRRVVEALACCR